MADETIKDEPKEEVIGKVLQVEMPHLPADFRGAPYGNTVLVSASANEIFLDLFQGGPEAGHRREAKVVFVGRFVFPLTIAKGVISQLQRLVDSIEKDKGIILPGPEE